MQVVSAVLLETVCRALCCVAVCVVVAREQFSAIIAARLLSRAKAAKPPL